jgi:hypothetical protein
MPTTLGILFACTYLREAFGRSESNANASNRKESSMNRPTLDMLLLTDKELQAAKKQVQQMAYFRWQNAGCPLECEQTFWNEAELEWIEYYYVPHRNEPTTEISSRSAQGTEFGFGAAGQHVRAVSHGDSR